MWRIAAVTLCVACSSSASREVVNLTVTEEGGAAGAPAVATPKAGAAGQDSGTDEDAESATDARAEAEIDSAPDADAAPACASEQKICDGVCTFNGWPEMGCAEASCEPCPEPAGSEGACVDGQCGFFCTYTRQVVKNGACVDDAAHTSAPYIANCGGEQASYCPASCSADRHCCTSGTWPAGGSCGCWNGRECVL